MKTQVTLAALALLTTALLAPTHAQDKMGKPTECAHCKTMHAAAKSKMAGKMSGDKKKM